MKRELINAHALTIRSEMGLMLYKGSFSVYEGEILAFCQTSQLPSFLLAILNQPGLRYEGMLSHCGKPVDKNNVIDCSYIDGANSLIDTLSVTDNLYALNGRTNGVIYNPRKAERTVREMMSALNLPFKKYESIDKLTVSQKYMLQLAKAIIRGSKIIVLDNISHNCSVNDYDWIRSTLVKYAKLGRTFILLSNEDNFLISNCDRVYFCRGTSIADLIFHDEYSHRVFQGILYGNHETASRNACSRVDRRAIAMEIQLPPALFGRKLTIYRGEIYGVFDLFGTLTDTVHEVFFSEFPYKIDGNLCHSYPEAVRNGLAIVSPHRRNVMFETFSLKEELLFPSIRKVSRAGIINQRMADFNVNRFLSKLKQNFEPEEEELERMKMLYYRWKLTKPKVMVIENPPLDLDVEQNKVIEALFDDAVNSGCAVLLVSSNAHAGMPLCDRALILQRDGDTEKTIPSR